MRESHFRIVIGIALITALYFNFNPLMIAIISIMAFEAITNYRIPMLVSKLRYGKIMAGNLNPGNACSLSFTRFNIEAERMLRVVIISILIPSYFIYPEQLWFFPWFVAFTLTGAGVSGICPMVIVLKRLGFK